MLLVKVSYYQWAKVASETIDQPVLTLEDRYKQFH